MTSSTGGGGFVLAIGRLNDVVGFRSTGRLGWLTLGLPIYRRLGMTK